MRRIFLVFLSACYAGPAIEPHLGKVLELPSVAEAGAVRRRETPTGFGELNTAKGRRRPRSCVEWELLHAQHAEPTNGVEGAADELARLRCDALDWLTRARPSTRSSVTWDQKLELPTSIATGEASWSDDTLTLRPTNSTSKVVVRPIAWADFNGDGNEDLLLAVSTLDTKGPATEHRAVALTRDNEQQPLRVMQR